MFNLLTQIRANLNFFSCSNKRLIAGSSNSSLLNCVLYSFETNGVIEKKKEIVHPAQKVLFDETKILLNTVYKISFELDPDFNEINRHEFHGKILIKELDLIAGLQFENKKKMLSVKKWSSFSEIWRSEGFSDLILTDHKDSLYLLGNYSQEKKIKKYNLFTGEIIFEKLLPLEKYGKNNKFIGSSNDKVFVAIYYIAVFEIDSNTGSVTRIWSELPEDQTWYINDWPAKTLAATNQAFLDEGQGIIACLYSFGYWEIDLISGDLNHFELRDYFLSEKLEPIDGGGLSFCGDHIFFSSCYTINEVIFAVAAFNRRTKKIDWKHIFTESVGTGIDQPVLNGDWLYVLDHKGTLHVFEKNTGKLDS